MAVARARSNVSLIATDIMDAWAKVKAGKGTEDDLVTLETHLVIGLRLMSKTNPSKLREIARTVEIAYLMKPQDGIPR